MVGAGVWRQFTLTTALAGRAGTRAQGREQRPRPASRDITNAGARSAHPGPSTHHQLTDRPADVGCTLLPRGKDACQGTQSGFTGTGQGGPGWAEHRRECRPYTPSPPAAPALTCSSRSPERRPAAGRSSRTPASCPRPGSGPPAGARCRPRPRPSTCSEGPCHSPHPTATSTPRWRLREKR